MKIVCCFYESGEQKPSNVAPQDVEILDLIAEQNRGNDFKHMLSRASIVLVHQTESSAETLWNRHIPTSVPGTCIVVEYTNGNHAFDPSKQKGPTYRVSHDDVTRNLVAFLTAWVDSSAPNIEILRAFPASDLSRAIHGLNNIAQPLDLDIETLGSVDGTSGDTVAEVWKDYFNESEPKKVGELPLGYLSRRRKFSNEVHGIENEIVKILHSIYKIPSVEDAGIMIKFCVKTELRAEKVEKELGIKDARRAAAQCKEDSECLKTKLAKVLAKIRSVVGELREIQKAA